MIDLAIVPNASDDGKRNDFVFIMHDLNPLVKASHFLLDYRYDIIVIRKAPQRNGMTSFYFDWLFFDPVPKKIFLFLFLSVLGLTPYP